MGLCDWLKNLVFFRRNEKYSADDQAVMEALAKNIPGAHIPGQGGNNSTKQAGRGLTSLNKPMKPTFLETARQEKAEKQVTESERQRLMSAGMGTSEVARIITQKQLAKEHCGNKAWEHFHGQKGKK